MQSRRRSRLPARATSQPPSTRCPSARTRSAASNAQHSVSTATAGHTHTGHRDETAAITSPTAARRPAAPTPAVQRLRVAAGPCARSGPVTASAVADQVGQHRLRRRGGARRQQQRRLPCAGDAGHHRVQPRAAEQPHQQRLGAACRRAAGACRRCARACAAGRARDAARRRRAAAPGCRTSPATAAPTAPPTRARRPRRRRRRWRRRRNARAASQTGLGEPRMLQRRTETRLVDHARRRRGSWQPGEAQRAVAQPRRLPACQHRTGVGAAGASSGGASESASRIARSRGTCSASHRVERERRVPVWPPGRC